jgi:hypothetical protein
MHDVAEISDAYKLLTPVLSKLPAFVCLRVAGFGQNSTLTERWSGKLSTS